MPKPDLFRVPPFYHNYIELVKNEHLSDAFIKHQHELLHLLQALSPDKWNYKYEPQKWTVKEVIQHVIDTERIFCFRALCFARKEKASLPGFDENNYARASNANRRAKEDLLQELGIVQQGSFLLFNSFDEGQLERSGTANGASIYVAAIGFIIIGHTVHHKQILEQRYLI